MCYTAHAEQVSHASTWVLKAIHELPGDNFHNKWIWKISVYRCCFSFTKWDNSLLTVCSSKPSLIQSDVPWFQLCRSQWRDCNIPLGAKKNPNLSILYLTKDTMEVHTRMISSFWRYLGGCRYTRVLIPPEMSDCQYEIHFWRVLLSSHRLTHVWIVHLWWPHYDEDGIEMLTTGHFLIGRPIETLPDSSYSYRSISLLATALARAKISSGISGKDGRRSICLP